MIRNKHEKLFCHPSILLFIFSKCFILVTSKVDLEHTEGTLGMRWEYNLDETPLYHHAHTARVDSEVL